MFLVFRKFWNLLVRKVARSTNREIELNASSNTSVVRLSNHFAALLHQIGLTVSQSVVDYLIIPCFTTDWKVIPSKLWLVHDLSFLLSYLCFFAPFVSSPLLRRWTQHFFRFNFLIRFYRLKICTTNSGFEFSLQFFNFSSSRWIVVATNEQICPSCASIRRNSERFGSGTFRVIKG